MMKAALELEQLPRLANSKPKKLKKKRADEKIQSARHFNESYTRNESRCMLGYFG